MASEPYARLAGALALGGLGRVIDCLIESLDEASSLWLGTDGDDGVVIYSHEAIVNYLGKYRPEPRAAES